MLPFWLLLLFGGALLLYGFYRTIRIIRQGKRSSQRSEKDTNSGTCEHCSVGFHYRLIHNGFNDSAYAYCDRCGCTVTVDAWSSHHPASLRLQYHRPLLPEAEPFLKPCPCGGSFRAGASPRCPKCKQTLSAELAATYIEANAAGTSKGWRWDRRWDGIYSMIIERRSVTNWWKSESV